MLRDGWIFTLRTDYLGVTIRQSFDARNNDGEIIRPAGALPILQSADVHWPDFQGFTIDSVFAGRQGDIHHSYYLPPDYDPARSYPLVVTLPGYGGLLHSLDDEARGVNVFSDRNALAWAQAEEDVIVLAPQLAGGSATAAQIIELTEHFLGQYAVDRDRVYAIGYSAGGEMMSRVLNSRADLFAAYVHASSRWNGSYDDVVANRLPSYVFMAENDEYYGPQRAREVHENLSSRYTAQAPTSDEIDRLVILDLPDNQYFNAQGIDYYHDGGQVVSDKKEIVNWVLDQNRS